jgi:hypothetical protein
MVQRLHEFSDCQTSIWHTVGRTSTAKPAVCVCYDTPTFGQQLFEAPRAEIEVEGEQHTVFDDSRWETECSYALERYTPTV